MPSPNSTDSNFERTFADLAYARLRDKAPSLLDFLIGFQLLDKNEEETHAVGVFGFKVGGEWVYCPVFFINGELKGHELMYIKNQDAFVPMTEEWVNYILNRRPSLLGETEKTPRNQLGIRQPDFDLFARTPYIGSKYASARPSFNEICSTLSPNFAPFMDVFTVSPKAEKYARLDTRFSLPHALKALGSKAAFAFFNTMKHDEQFADSVLKFYDLKELLGHEKTAEKVTHEGAGYKEHSTYSQCKGCANYSSGSCKLVAGKISPDGTCNYYDAEYDKNTELKPLDSSEPLRPAGTKEAADDGKHTITFDEAPYRKNTEKKVTVVTRGDDLTGAMKDMSEADKKKLFKDQYVVHDDRSDDQRSRIYRSQFAATISGPTESGVYDVITNDTTKRKMIVVLHPVRVGYMFDKYPEAVVVIDTDNKARGAFHKTDILVGQRYGGLGDMEGLIEVGSLGIGDLAMLVGPGGEATAPFEVNEKNDLSDGSKELRIWGSCQISPSSSLQKWRKPQAPREEYEPSTINTIVLTDKRVDDATRIGEALFVPKTWKGYVIQKGKKRDGMGAIPSTGSSSTLNIGTLSDIILKMNKSAQAGDIHRLRMLTDGISFQIELDSRQSQKMSKLACLKHLILQHQMSEVDAQMLLKEAQPRKAETYWVKYAYNSQPISGYFPEPNMGQEYGINAPVNYPQTMLQNLGSNDSLSNREFYRDDRYIDQAAKQQATTASRQGQKEVLDTSVISGLVKTMDTDSQVDGYIGDLLLGLDRIGRIMFMFYWHNDKFKDRYGQQDMVELEDNLRNVFKNLGELALFLKQKTIEPDAQRGSEAELSEVLS